MKARTQVEVAVDLSSKLCSILQVEIDHEDGSAEGRSMAHFVRFDELYKNRCFVDKIVAQDFEI